MNGPTPLQWTIAMSHCGNDLTIGRRRAAQRIRQKLKNDKRQWPANGRRRSMISSRPSRAKTKSPTKWNDRFIFDDNSLVGEGGIEDANDSHREAIETIQGSRTAAIEQSDRKASKIRDTSNHPIKRATKKKRSKHPTGKVNEDNPPTM